MLPTETEGGEGGNMFLNSVSIKKRVILLKTRRVSRKNCVKSSWDFPVSMIIQIMFPPSLCALFYSNFPLQNSVFSEPEQEKCRHLPLPIWSIISYFSVPARGLGLGPLELIKLSWIRAVLTSVRTRVELEPARFSCISPFSGGGVGM